VEKEKKHMNRDFGILLRKLRMETSPSLRKAAEAMGVSPAYLCQVEQGNYAPFSRTTMMRALSVIGGTNAQREKLLQDCSIRDTPRGKVLRLGVTKKHMRLAKRLAVVWDSLSQDDIGRILQAIGECNG
jgi:transcriptional regulator with XRE-family HTH domain